MKRFLRKISAATEGSDFEISEDGILVKYHGDANKVTIPRDVTEIGRCAFYNYTGLTSVKIPNSVTSIGEDAFSGCARLKSITIPDSVTSIGKYAFAWCKDLTDITLPNGLKSIGNGAFYLCESLHYPEIPESVVEIGEDAFTGCGNKYRDVQKFDSRYRASKYSGNGKGAHLKSKQKYEVCRRRYDRTDEGNLPEIEIFYAYDDIDAMFSYYVLNYDEYDIEDAGYSENPTLSEIQDHLNNNLDPSDSFIFYVKNLTTNTMIYENDYMSVEDWCEEWGIVKVGNKYIYDYDM